MRLILLGLLQGLTEFLPVSSSGHLVILEKYFFVNVDKQALQYMNVLLHVSTLCAIAVFFRGVLKESVYEAWRWFFCKTPPSSEALNLWVLLFLGSLPTALIGLSLEGLVLHASENLLYVAGGLVCTGVVLQCSRVRSTQSKDRYARISVRDVLIIGACQGIAVLPGISRSGVTISIALCLGLSREKAGELSFLLSFPAIFGATALELVKMWSVGGYYSVELSEIVVGGLCAFVSGYAMLSLMFRVIYKNTLHYFSYYCFLMAALLFIFLV